MGNGAPVRCPTSDWGPVGWLVGWSVGWMVDWLVGWCWLVGVRLVSGTGCWCSVRPCGSMRCSANDLSFSTLLRNRPTLRVNTK